MSQVDEVLFVNEHVLKGIVIKKAKSALLQGDWALRKQEAGIGFEERERARLKQEVEDAKSALYFKLLEFETVKHYTNNPPPLLHDTT